MQQRAAKYLIILLYSAAAAGAVWLCLRFLLPWAAPFIVAFALAALFEPLVRSMVAGGWKRAAAAGIVSLTVLLLFAFVVFRLASASAAAVTRFAKQVPELMSGVGTALGNLKRKITDYVNRAPEGSGEYLQKALDAVAESIYSLPAAGSQWALDAVGRIAQHSPDILLFSVTAGIGTYFISASYPRTTAFLSAQLPDSFRRRMEGLGTELKASFGGFMRAQLILMAMTFFQLLTAFLLLRVNSAPLIAAVTALVDALPVFGTGIVLLPWAAYCFLLGDIGRGLGLVIVWGTVNLVRSCTQAKLLGDQIGLDPIVSLLAIYIGWRVCGVWGMLLFPIIFATVQQLNDKGVIHLWKSI